MINRAVCRTVGMLVVAAALAGCGSHTVPVAQVNPEVRVGPVLVSDVHVVRPASGSYAPGSSASVDFLLQNSGSEREYLDGASSPAASRVELLLDGRSVPSVLLPADRTVTRGTQLRLVLQKGLTPGESVPITLRFRRAGDVTVQAPLR